jgi:glucose/arabinose dehydrogenase
MIRSLARSISCASVWLALVSGPATAATVPPGFAESQVAAGLQNPTAMAFAPDGRLFVCEQGGQLRIIKDGGLVPAPFVTVTVNSFGERGLLGVAFDPAFDTNQFVYVYYTATTPTLHNRVSRFTANGDLAVPGSEVVLLELETLGASNHNGGAIHFGVDGKLYVAVGENGIGSNAQSLENRLGKMLRINADGSIPADNPFYLTATGVNRSIWALGLRNPFTFAIHPSTGTMFINDVGQNTWEEVNEGVAGANYGWPETEGPTPDPRFISPLYAYDHSSGCAIAGAAFYAPPIGQFPPEYTDAFFFADLCGGWIRQRDANGSASEFATGISNPVDVQVSGGGSLYYLARGFGSATGVVYRIDYTATPPSVRVTANGTDGPLSLGSQDPLAVAISFDAGSAGAIATAEVYVGVSTPGGLFWLNPATQSFVPAVTRAYTGPLPSFGPLTVVNLPNVSMLAAGRYRWFAIVDRDSNGVPGGDVVDGVLTVVLSPSRGATAEQPFKGWSGWPD